MNRFITGLLAISLALAPAAAQRISTTPSKNYVAVPNYTANGGLPKWQACRAKLKAGTSNCKILVIGESTPAGWGSGWQTNDYGYARATAWPSQIAAILPLAYGVPASANGVFGNAGAGGVANGTAAAFAAYDKRVTQNGWAPNVDTFLTAGGNLFFNDTNSTAFAFDPSNTAQFPTALAVQTDTLVFFPGLTSASEVFSIAVNGGSSLGTITDNTTSFAPHSFTTTLAHNVWDISCPTLGSFGCYFGGFYAYNSAVKQVLMINAGWAGATVGNWNTSDGQPWDPLLAIEAVAPDLCLIQIDGNDAGAGTSIPTFVADKEAMVTACQMSGDAMIITSQPAPPSGTPYATVQPYIQADYTVATAKNIPILDWFLTLCGADSGGACPNGGWNAGEQAGWGPQNFGSNGSTDPHQGPPAYGVLASYIAQILMQ
jgi:hypothetical protein